MGFRTIVIVNSCKLSYKQGYLIVRNEVSNLIHLSEIDTIIIDSTMVSITTYLIAELLKRKIKVVLCDEKRDPIGEVIPYYGSHNTSKRVVLQTRWDEKIKGNLWTRIVKQKIFNQADVLKRVNKDGFGKLYEYMDQVEYYDSSNREGHAAKVYFNILFGKDFSRDTKTHINDALDYGYSIILSTFNKEIVSKGYITQLGIFHRNEFNQFNLSCDLMEPFRPIVDFFVFNNKNRVFDKHYRLDLVNLINKKVIYCKKNLYLNDCIKKYTQNTLEFLSEGYLKEEKFLYFYEL